MRLTAGQRPIPRRTARRPPARRAFRARCRRVTAGQRPVRGGASGFHAASLSVIVRRCSARHAVRAASSSTAERGLEVLPRLHASARNGHPRPPARSSRTRRPGRPGAVPALRCCARRPRRPPSSRRALRRLEDRAAAAVVPPEDGAEGRAAARHAARLPRPGVPRARADQKDSAVTRLPPAVFERYIAASARCIRSSTSSPGSTSATPDAGGHARCGRPRPATACRSRSASISPEKVDRDVGQDGELVAAEPGDGVGLADRARRGRWPTALSMASPAACPAGSLTRLEAVEVDQADDRLVAPGGGVDGRARAARGRPGGWGCR